MLFTGIFIFFVATFALALTGLAEAHLGVSRLFDELSNERSPVQKNEKLKSAA